jgi:DNA-binding CsgD family transcriptional regulator
VERELDLARRCQIPRTLGVALRAAARVAGEARKLDLLHEAVTVLTATPARLELARTYHDLGVASMHRGDKSGARGFLRRGLELAAACEAKVLVRRLRGRLHEVGGRVGRSARYGSGALAAGEERVSALAAQGLSNKEIAELLVVSLRTVEAHLTNAYRKLGIAGRSHLAAAMGNSPRT